MMTLRAFIALLRAELSIALTYRSAFGLKLLTSLMYVCLPLYFWDNIFSDGMNHNGFSLETVCIYTVWSSVLFAIHTDYSHIFGQQLRNGTVAVELTRPYAILVRLFASFSAQRLAEGARSVPILVVMGLHLPFSLLPQGGILGPFLVSIVLGVGVAFGLDVTVGFISILTVNTWGLRLLRFACMSILSGATMPIDLLPRSVQILTEFLPFRAIIASPLAILIGDEHTRSVNSVIMSQFIWVFIMLTTAVVTWRLLRPRLVVYGG